MFFDNESTLKFSNLIHYMNLTLIFIILFLAGTFHLMRTNHERFIGIIFMIRTKYGLELLDRAANISPRLWKFIADFAVVLSFAGLGSWYIAKHRRIEPILIIFYIAASLIYYLSEGLSVATGILLIILLLLIVSLITNFRNNPKTAFMFGFILFFLIASKLFPDPLVGMGNDSILVSAPEIANLILLIFIGIIGIPALLVGSLMFQGFMILTETSNTPGISPILPSEKDGRIGLSPRGEGFGDFFIPIQYALIAFAVLLIVHEFAHGVLARVEKIPVKSAGLLTLGPLPIGGFVEPDEELLKKGNGIKNMRISVMGSFANFVTALVFFIMLFSVIPLLFTFCVSNDIIEFEGVVIDKTLKGYPAYEVIEDKSIIYSINDKRVTTPTAFSEAMLNISPYQNITLTTDKGTFNLTTVENPENATKAHIGVYMNPVPHTSKPTLTGAFYTIMELFYWIFLLNLMIGLVNLLPLVFFDGGRMFNELVNSFKLGRNAAKQIIYAVIVGMLIVVLVNISPLFNVFVEWIGSLV